VVVRGIFFTECHSCPGATGFVGCIVFCFPQTISFLYVTFLYHSYTSILGCVSWGGGAAMVRFRLLGGYIVPGVVVFFGVRAWNLIADREGTGRKSRHVGNLP